jgi:hypothetical protein
MRHCIFGIQVQHKPYRDGTTHVIFEPEDFIARLAALVPKPRAHLTRYHGVLAPASPDRARIVPRLRTAAATERAEVSVSDRQRTMSWAQRLKRVFTIDLETSATAAAACASSPASRRQRLLSGFWNISATRRSPSTRRRRAGRRRRPIAESDRQVMLVTTRGTVPGRAGFGF